MLFGSIYAQGGGGRESPVWGFEYTFPNYCCLSKQILNFKQNLEFHPSGKVFLVQNQVVVSSELLVGEIKTEALGGGGRQAGDLGQRS